MDEPSTEQKEGANLPEIESEIAVLDSASNSAAAAMQKLGNSTAETAVAMQKLGNSTAAFGTNLIKKIKPKMKYDGTIRKRQFRIFCLLIVMGFLVGITCLMLWLSKITSPIYAYDPSDELIVKVRSCDVKIRPGDDFAFQFEWWSSSGTKHTLIKSLLGKGEKYGQVSVTNPGGCDSAYQESCKKLCHVVVYVKEESSKRPYFISVQQDPADKASRVSVEVAPGVDLENLVVTGTSVEISMQDFRTDYVRAWTTHGLINCTNCDFKSADLRSTLNSVYVTDTKPMNRSLDLKFRATEHKTCWDVTGKNASITHGGGSVWSSTCSLESNFYMSMLSSTFDQDNNGVVMVDEFNNGMSTIQKCCGARCPFSSWCGSIQYALFPIAGDTNTHFGSNGLYKQNFIKRVEQNNLTELVPYCFREGKILDLSSQDSSSLKMLTTAGELRVKTYTGTADVQAENETRSFFASEGKVSGIRMLQQHADMLMADVREVYGSLETEISKDVFIVIDVVETPNGIPGGRWVYTTKLFYLELDPVSLQYLTAGLMVPNIKYYRIMFTNSDCDAEATRRRADGKWQDHEERTKAIYRQLYDALVPPYQHELRGLLVLLDDSDDQSNEPLVSNVKFSTYLIQGAGARTMFPGLLLNLGELIKVDSRDLKLDESLPRTALLISMIIGILLGLFLTASLQHVLRIALKKKREAARIRENVIAMSKGKKPTENVKESDAEHQSSRSNAGMMGALNKNPFEKPMILIEICIVQPLSSMLTDSCQKFVYEKCLFDDDFTDGRVDKSGKKKSCFCLHALLSRIKNCICSPKSSAVATKPDVEKGQQFMGGSVSYRMRFTDFTRAYSDYCFLHGLQEKTDLKTIQQFLITRFNIRFRKESRAQLFGIRWKTDHITPTGEWEDLGSLKWKETKHMKCELDLKALNEEDVSAGDGVVYSVVNMKLLDEFVKIHCEVGDVAAKDTIEYNIMKRGHGGETVPGFRVRFAAWARAERALQGLPPTERLTVNANLDSRVDFWLERHAVKREMEDVIYIKGMRLIDFEHDAKKAKLGKAFFVTESFTVLCHVVFTAFLPCILLRYLIYAQYRFVNTLATTKPLEYLDIYLPMKESTSFESVVELVQITFWLLVIFLCCGFFRIFAHYYRGPIKFCGYVFSDTMPDQVRTFIEKAFAVLLILFVFLNFSAICTIGCWLALSAFISPSDYLSYGIAAVTLFVVIATTYTQMSAQATKYKNAFRALLRSQIESSYNYHKEVKDQQAEMIKRKEARSLRQRKLAQVEEEKAEEEKAEEAAAGAVAEEATEGEAATVAAAEPEKEKVDEDEFEVADLYRLLIPEDVDEESFKGIGIDDLHRLWNLLEVQMDEKKTDMIMAYADTDHSGLISEDEFVEAWNWIEGTLAEQAVDDMGLSMGKIITTVIFLTAIFLLFCVFLFVAMLGYSNGGSFESVIQSMFVMGGGYATRAAKRKSEDVDEAALRNKISGAFSVS